MTSKHIISSLFVVSLSLPLQAALPPLRPLRSAISANANSIVRLDQTEFELLSKSNGNEKRTRIITVSHKEGREDAAFILHCDQFREMKQFAGELYGASGDLIRKFKKSDLIRTEYFEGLASDNYAYILEIPANINLPYTVRYEWEVKHKNGLIGFPMFYPLQEYNQSVDTATYQITMAPGEELNYQEVNCKLIPTELPAKKGKTYLFATGSIAAIEHEPLGLSLNGMVPHIYFKPTEFIFDGTQGDLSNWNSFGKWQANLLEQRDQLPDKAKQKVRELTAHCSNDREKVKALYDYLGKTTRYVSMQLGIGGLQPFRASDVFSSGFSDCKGLSNYLHSLLKEVGIPSVYTVISTNRSRLMKDFATANQMNHVILQVPLPGDTLWLECTNPDTPFGYVHSEIAGHDALLIHPEGGAISRLPEYPDSLNMESYAADIRLQPDGTAQSTVTRSSHLLQHEMRAYLIKQEESKQKDNLRSSIKLPNAHITQLQLAEKKEAHPNLSVCYETEMVYGTQTGNRMFIPTNIFRQGFREFSSRKPRKQPVVISAGYIDSDTIRIHLPEGYQLESMPMPVMLKSDFGSFRTAVLPVSDTILVIQSLHMRKGSYPVEQYEAFRNFTEAVSKGYNSKLILKKKPVE